MYMSIISKNIPPLPVWIYYSLLCSFCREYFQLTLLLFQPLNCIWMIKHKWKKKLLIACSCLDFFLNKTFHRQKEGCHFPWTSLYWRSHRGGLCSAHHSCHRNEGPARSQIYAFCQTHSQFWPVQQVLLQHIFLHRFIFCQQHLSQSSLVALTFSSKKWHKVAAAISILLQFCVCETISITNLEKLMKATP